MKMKLPVIRVLTDRSQKQGTRSLYERIFSDSPAYIDYYYGEKCKDNVIFTAAFSEDSEPAAMLHLNPYLLSVCGKAIRSFMVAAVATEPAYRHRGLMRTLLEEAFSFAKEKKIPFLFLLPVNEEIYRPFGFDCVGPFPDPAVCGRNVPSDADVYVIETEEILRRREEEKRIDEESDVQEPLPEHPVLMAAVSDAAAFDEMAGISFSDDAERLAWLRSRKVWIQEEV